jgi:hypothetical protein
MGSLSLSFFKKIIIFCLILFSSLSISGVKLEGVDIPEKLTCAGQELPVSGYGLRTATFFKIKIYVLGIYANKKIQQGRIEELNQRPLCFSFTYLKDFSDKDVDRAWDYQFKESADHSYPELKNDLKSLKSFFGEIKGNRKQMIEIHEDSVQFYENDKNVGTIKGKDFQKAFLSIWFGKNPPTEDLKKSLLGKN